MGVVKVMSGRDFDGRLTFVHRHGSADAVCPSDVNPVRNTSVGAFGVKPDGDSGLFLSVDDGWEKWCETEEMGDWVMNRPRDGVRLRDDARILVIDSVESLGDLPKNDSVEPILADSVTSLDFESLARDYDGMYVSITADNDLYFALYSWDVDTLLLFDGSALESATPLFPWRFEDDAQIDGNGGYEQWFSDVVCDRFPNLEFAQITEVQDDGVAAIAKDGAGETWQTVSEFAEDGTTAWAVHVDHVAADGSVSVVARKEADPADVHAVDRGELFNQAVVDSRHAVEEMAFRMCELASRPEMVVEGKRDVRCDFVGEGTHMSETGMSYDVTLADKRGEPIDVRAIYGVGYGEPKASVSWEPQGRYRKSGTVAMPVSEVARRAAQASAMSAEKVVQVQPPEGGAKMFYAPIEVDVLSAYAPRDDLDLGL